MLSEQSEAMERCSLSPVTRLTTLGCLLPLLLVALVTRPSTCNRDDTGRDGRQEDVEGQVSLLGGGGTGGDRPAAAATAAAATPPSPSEQSGGAHGAHEATPTPLWAVVWGPTQLLEDETHHFLLSSQETERHHPHLHGGVGTGGGGGGGGGSQQETSTGAAEAWLYPGGGEPGPGATQTPQHVEPIVDARDVDDAGTGAEESEPEEVDPQFYVTVTISSLLILTAVIITAKLCYDRSCSHHPPPLSRGVAPPLSLALPRSLASEDSRQTLHSSPYNDRERIPVVNL